MAGEVIAMEVSSPKPSTIQISPHTSIIATDDLEHNPQGEVGLSTTQCTMAAQDYDDGNEANSERDPQDNSDRSYDSSSDYSSNANSVCFDRPDDYDSEDSGDGCSNYNGSDDGPDNSFNDHPGNETDMDGDETDIEDEWQATSEKSDCQVLYEEFVRILQQDAITCRITQQKVSRDVTDMCVRIFMRNIGIGKTA